MRVERLLEHEWERLRSLRLAALRDAPAAFGTTYEECVAWSDSRWQERLRDTVTFVARIETEDVGLVGGVLADGVPYLISMWVAPHARRCGAGTALLTAVVEWARSLGKAELLLDVREDNHAAIALYERAGFRATGNTKLEESAGLLVTEREFSRALLP